MPHLAWPALTPKGTETVAGGARQDDMALNRTAKQDYKQTNGRCTWQLLWSPVGCMKEKKDHICMMSLMDLHLGYCHNYYIDKIKVLIHKFCRAAKSIAKKLKGGLEKVWSQCGVDTGCFKQVEEELFD